MGAMTEVDYDGTTYRVPAEQLGGTAAAPRIKPADKLLLDRWRAIGGGPVGILHDVTGGLSLVAAPAETVNDNSGYDQRITALYAANGRGEPPVFSGPLDEGAAPGLQLMRVPKSLDLFDLYLRRVAAGATAETRLLAAFMTRHFTPRLVTLAERYAAAVTQSRAYKKARLLEVSSFRDFGGTRVRSRVVEYGGRRYEHLPGVFAANRIDPASRLLLDVWGEAPALRDLPPPALIVDAACGGGVLGDQLLERYPRARLVAYDVSRLAVASATANLADRGPRATVHLACRLADVPLPQPPDLVVTNPPFHDGHRNDIGPALALFADSAARLRPGGRLVVVANRHLNYGTHLERLGRVTVVGKGGKFEVLMAKSSV